MILASRNNDNNCGVSLTTARKSKREVAELRQLVVAASSHQQAQSTTQPFVDIVWMQDGWEFLIPIMQKRLDTITSHRCVIRKATYNAQARMELSSLAGARVLIPAMQPINQEILDAAGPGLELVYQPGVDVSRIDMTACEKKGIVACNAPGYNANAMAETVVMLMLALARDLPGGIQRCLNPPNGWGGPAGFELRGLTLGIIGHTGNTGVMLRTICENGFGMKVRGVNSKSTRLEFESLLAESDILSINCTLKDSTRNLLSRQEFGIMKDGAILVNCARAGIVDRVALEAALDSGRLRGVGLDNHWDEPCHPGDALLQRPNVIGTPHLAASTQQWFDALSEVLRVNVEAILKDDPTQLKHRMI